MSQYLSAVKASEIAGVSQQTILNHINKGTLKASPVKQSSKGTVTKWMIDEDDLLDWMETRPKKERTTKMDSQIERAYDAMDTDEFTERWKRYQFVREQAAYNKGFKDGEESIINKLMEFLRDNNGK